MKKNALFGGKKVILVAPGQQSAKIETDFTNFHTAAVVGDFWTMSRLLVPRTIPRIDAAYCNASFAQRIAEYNWKLPENVLFPISEGFLQPDHLPMTSPFVPYSFSFEWMCNQIGCNLTTGMAAIIDILLQQPASLHLHGFNFYLSESPYIPGYASKFETKLITATKGNLSGHNQTLLFDYFKKHLAHQVTMDETLQNLVSLS